MVKKPLEIIIPAHLEILSTVKINSPSGTARATIKGILKKKRKNNLSFNKKNLKKAEEQLQSAFVHFYGKLELLKSFSYLNLLAFSKTMKKYDKITSRHASKIYLHMVDNSYIGSSDDVSRLMDRVEASFIKHFSKSNLSEGMDILSSKKKKERHVTTFFSEMSSRKMALRSTWKLCFHYIVCSASLPHALVFSSHILLEAVSNQLLIHILLSTILATAALACVLANLDMELDISTKKYKAITELLPLALVSVILLIIVCPFNIVYRSSRMFLLRTTFRSISAPLYKVTLSDFMLADQLSSQGQALRSVAFYICYYTSNDYKRRETYCKADVVYNSFYIALTAFPFWLRALRCFRRYFEEKNGMQGINGFKYLSIVLSVSIVTAHSKRHTMGLYVMAWISAISAAVVSIYWDIVFDWGLLQKNSKNPWLRDKLLVPHKSVYFGIMIMDVLLRFAWLQTVLNIQVSFLHKEAMVVVVACLEIFRRGVWNFFRIENEHLNNVGKFRAFTTVPLPFNYHELEDKMSE
ncbi:phosphate transporter PHO1 homolog 3-like [Papaver somniferum]|uniref:phosphate transporter PHO1 homolog 3-like n=1 Tax=Papaver somniferum TaxID=3469 RepID=UPI000E701446|nr:phosphate transporter PHO1 homolog 3-like [Papaver somniferum]